MATKKVIATDADVNFIAAMMEDAGYKVSRKQLPDSKWVVMGVRSDGSNSEKKWRVANSLVTLLDQINQIAPKRSKKSDGTIGDAAHKQTNSDHNPRVDDNGQGVVTALDITHDVQNGCDCQKIADALVRSKDPRIKYIIWKSKIVSSKKKPWLWRKYNGKNPHSKHIHVSVDSSKKLYDSTAPWNLFEVGASLPIPTQSLAWGQKVSKPFARKVRKISRGLDVDPSLLMAVMAFETGRTFKPNEQNRMTRATGLIQFMPKTAVELGTTIEKLEKMTAVKQLDYVEAYLKPYSGKIRDIFDLYMSVLWPAAITKPHSEILFSRSKRPSAYNANKGLDTNNDGAVTKAEAGAKVVEHLAEGMRTENVG